MDIAEENQTIISWITHKHIHIHKIITFITKYESSDIFLALVVLVNERIWKIIPPHQRKLILLKIISDELSMLTSIESEYVIVFWDVKMLI